MHSKGPYSSREITLLRQAVRDYDRSMEPTEVLAWIARQVGTRSAPSVSVQLARMVRARQLAAEDLPEFTATEHGPYYVRSP